MPVKQQVVQSCTGHWKVGMFQAPAAAPPQCVYGCLCPCCASFQQRNTLLDITGEPYVCCAGLFPCCGIDKPQQDRNCLYLEACCCPGLAISGNRFMVQTRFDKENTPCDDCILWTTCLCVYGIEIARCCGVDIPEELDLLADCLVLTVNGCMHAQQYIEIEDIKKNGYSGPPSAIMAAMPPAQQSMMQGSKPAAAFGAPPTVVGSSAAGKTKPVQQQQQSNQYSNAPQAAPPQQQFQPQPQQGGSAIQIRCGACSQIFGSPSYGVTVACPYCTSHNVVPPAQGTVVAASRPPASTGFGSGFGSGYNQQQGGGRGTSGVAAGAIGAGAGIVGGMILADALF
mmetsp:Transcript_8920/g.16023  ORF Transcript_8920/g.16023 Transcript_8920/m.16023 type:complete len:341 (+) Transcript_8920:99-1121(+)